MGDQTFGEANGVVSYGDMLRRVGGLRREMPTDDNVGGVGLPEAKGQPRLHPPKLEAWGGRVGALVDPDGTLIRLIRISGTDPTRPALRHAAR